MSIDARNRLLTAAHLCTQQHCQEEWQDTEGRAQPINRWVADVVCPHCQGTSSLFAILHRCRGCGAELESPSATAGEEFRCPGCGVLDIIPGNWLHSLDDPTWIAEECFQVQCPDCHRDWIAERKHSRRRVVCRNCHTNFPLLSGQAIRDHRPHTQEKRLLCRSCQTHIPVNVTACPICGLRPPFGT